MLFSSMSHYVHLTNIAIVDYSNQFKIQYIVFDIVPPQYPIQYITFDIVYNQYPIQYIVLDSVLYNEPIKLFKEFENPNNLQYNIV